MLQIQPDLAAFGIVEMRAFFKNLFALLIGLLIAVGVLEVAANAFVYLGLNVSRSEYIDYYEKNPNVALLTWMIPYKPHPYFGYENQAIRIFERSEFDRSKDFVVGILGGSVAMSLGDYLRDHTQHFDILRISLRP